MSIVLASGSPRRSQLLGDAGFTFTVIKPEVDESFDAVIPVMDVPLIIANNKMAVAKTMCRTNDIIITADTVVVLEDTIIGKPTDRDDAIRILKALSGKMHTVVSGVCISQGTRQYDITVSTKVYFDVLQETEIHYYLDKYQPYDKAGAYAIQEWIGINKITRIEGDYYNVVGFPMSKIFPVLSALLDQ